MTLRSRLILGLLTIALILVVPLLIAVQAMDRLHRDARALRDKEFAASLLLGRLREGLNDLRRQETALLFVHDAHTRDVMEKQLDIVASITDSLKTFNLDKSAGDVSRSIADIVAWAPHEYAAALAEQRDTAEKISATYLVPALTTADRSVLEAERALRQRTAERVASAAIEISRAKNVSAMAEIVALIVAALIGIWLTRSIARPVRDLEEGMEAVASGNLGYKLQVRVSRRDEFGRLAASFEEMTKQLTELDKLKAEFVSVASHELKTPINVVQGYVQLLDEGVYGALTDRQRAVLQTLEMQIQSLARLVKQLLDVSRFEAGGSKLDIRQVQLDPFLDQLERSFHVLAVQRSIRFIVRRGDGLPSEVLWDSDRMNEVLGNLLSNAFKFTPRAGEVELAVESVDHSVQIEVRDSGSGIPPEQMPHIFEKFFQADNQVEGSVKGSGLGLAIAKSIVEAHGGTINCESTPGVGTTFSIVLPTRTNSRISVPQREPAEAA
ncbi:MAG TPA: HAMP domain-containing sensor histidine kinase [Gemmatimonadaceae bacterium]|nr:HAMP domain-containing sensor histidine kinase [Gemmatimonadaceae bacterium]